MRHMGEMGAVGLARTRSPRIEHLGETSAVEALGEVKVALGGCATERSRVRRVPFPLAPRLHKAAPEESSREVDVRLGLRTLEVRSLRRFAPPVAPR